MSTTRVSFVPSESDHGRFLTCRAENPHLPANNGVEDQWKIQVQCELHRGANTHDVHTERGGSKNQKSYGVGRGPLASLPSESDHARFLCKTVGLREEQKVVTKRDVYLE